MKKVIALFFLALLSSSLQHAMEIENERLKNTVIPIPNYSTIDQYQATRNTSECLALNNLIRQSRCCNFWTDKRQLETIAKGIGTGALVFGIIEAFTAGFGAAAGNHPEFAIKPLVLYLTGCTGLMACLLYVCMFTQWHRYEYY